MCTLLVAHTAHAQGLSEFTGNWRGKGLVRLSEGAEESFTCLSYNYGSNASIKFTLRCANASTSYEFRALVHASSTLSGTWEIRTYNAEGSLVGTIAKNRLQGTLEGSGYKGSFSVTRTESALLMSVVSTDGKSFTATLKK